MEYLTEALWYASWPVVIFLSVKFVMVNLKHFAKMEKLESLEKKQ